MTRACKRKARKQAICSIRLVILCNKIQATSQTSVNQWMRTFSNHSIIQWITQAKDHPNQSIRCNSCTHLVVSVHPSWKLPPPLFGHVCLGMFELPAACRRIDDPVDDGGWYISRIDNILDTQITSMICQVPSWQSYPHSLIVVGSCWPLPSYTTGWDVTGRHAENLTLVPVLRRFSGLYQHRQSRLNPRGKGFSLLCSVCCPNLEG